MKKNYCLVGIGVAVLGFGLSLLALAAPAQQQSSFHSFFKDSSKTIRVYGPYIGMLLGASDTHYGRSGFDNTSDNQDVTNGTVNSSGFGQRALFGWRFNHYFAAEIGGSHFGQTSGNHLAYNGGSTNVSGTISEYAIDLMGKAIYPIAQEVDLFGKLGLAEMFSKTKTDSGINKSRNTLSAAYGLGAAFVITQKFLVDVSYNRLQGSGRIEPADLFGLTFYYHLR